MLVIPRPVQDLRILLLTEYHDNVGHPNWLRLLATSLKQFWWEGMFVDCKAHCSICVVCNRAKPNRHGSSSFSPLCAPNYPWEIVCMYFVTDLPKSPKFNFNAILILLVITKSYQKKLMITLLTSVTNFMVFLKSLYILGIPDLLSNFGIHS